MRSQRLERTLPETYRLFTFGILGLSAIWWAIRLNISLEARRDRLVFLLYLLCTLLIIIALWNAPIRPVVDFTLISINFTFLFTGWLLNRRITGLELANQRISARNKILKQRTLQAVEQAVKIRNQANRIETQRQQKIKFLNQNYSLIEASTFFVPEEMLHLIGISSLTDATLGLSRTIEAAVLFCDIRGFTALSSHMPPDELLVGLVDYFTFICEPVLDNDGAIDKFIGDAIMAIFPSVNDAARAGLGIVNAVTEFNQSEDFIPLEVGIGIHWGPVTAGIIGTPGRKEATIIGDSVNTASRIESLTKHYPAASRGFPGTILLSGDAAKQINGDLNMEMVDKVTIRGKIEDVELWRLKPLPEPLFVTQGH